MKKGLSSDEFRDDVELIVEALNHQAFEGDVQTPVSVRLKRLSSIILCIGHRFVLVWKNLFCLRITFSFDL